MNISLCEHKSGQMLQAVKQPLTWIPETFDARFPVSVNSSEWAVCPHLSSALSKFKCLAIKHSCLNPLWTYFLVTCPRLDLNDGITARGCAWMSPEETVVVLRWLDWIFWGWYLPSLSINYVGMSKDMEKRLPQLYYIKMKISYDLGFIAIGVAMAT